MKKSAYKLVAAIGALGMALHVAPAFSARPPSVVSGNVTSVQARSIVVNGVSYDVQLQGGALRQLAQLHVGDKVQLVLTGAKGARTTLVSSIRVEHAH